MISHFNSKESGSRVVSTVAKLYYTHDPHLIVNATEGELFRVEEKKINMVRSFVSFRFS
jgi:hypothetical protein